jgi:hypothetical protein
VGHVITEYSLDIEKIRSDFTDVHKKYMSILNEASKTKHQFDVFDKKMQDMCSKQLNKLELTYKSIAKILEQKKREMGCAIKEFYSE